MHYRVELAPARIQEVKYIILTHGQVVILLVVILRGLLLLKRRHVEYIQTHYLDIELLILQPVILDSTLLIKLLPKIIMLFP